MEKITINEKDYKGIHVPTENTALLIIQGEKGMLACGYINIETADKLDEKVVIVTGVKNFDDMLKAKVFKCSNAARECGVNEEMTGEQALAFL
jgi:uncharacterized protein YunC (DUF1805 family)